MRGVRACLGAFRNRSSALEVRDIMSPDTNWQSICRSIGSAAMSAATETEASKKGTQGDEAGRLGHWLPNSNVGHPVGPRAHINPANYDPSVVYGSGGRAVAVVGKDLHERGGVLVKKGALWVVQEADDQTRAVDIDGRPAAQVVQPAVPAKGMRCLVRVGGIADHDARVTDRACTARLTSESPEVNRLPGGPKHCAPTWEWRNIG